MSSSKAASRIALYFVAAVVFVFVLGITDAAAQGITDCKVCGITCTPTACYQNCIRMSYTDCTRYHMECAGLCYTYYDNTYSSYQCRTDPVWYPCYA